MLDPHFLAQRRQLLVPVVAVSMLVDAHFLAQRGQLLAPVGGVRTRALVNAHLVIMFENLSFQKRKDDSLR